MLSSPARACEDWVAKVVAIEGQVQRQNGQQDWQAVQREQRICPGDSVKVGGNSRASLHLRNNTFTRLDADSLLRFPAQNRERHFWIELRQGVAHFISRIVHQFEVSTPYVNAVVEGTEFVVTAREQGAVAVMEGKVTAYNEKARTSLVAGEQVSSAGRDQDLSRFNVPANTLVEWAIYYPPVLSLADLPTQTEQEKSALNAAIDALKQNRIDQAHAGLESAPKSDVVQLAQATLLLQLGRIPEFNRTVEPLLQGSLSGQAYGLKAIAAVSRNEIESARANADLAVQRAPDSASSWLALSYVQQADLHLNAAQESASKALDVQPSSVLAYLRVSELYLAQGDVNAAHKTLASVPEDAANSAELEGSKGFVQLFRLKLDSAREHFNRALAMDSNNPQYQLGLGLTLLRDGDLAEGRQHIEYAVNLDPLRSVLRSYLGRAYFEEKRDKVAVEQWELAKQFDPNDPTPYFYSGVEKLFDNDPIGAVEDLETSRDLNDKRALYRSETLLQSDAASRSATLARAYDEVGYDQGVLLSGWDALRRDPTSSEGHRLMADFYAGDPRYETARVSELLQSQIWQPLSAYPLQPQLSEANLAVVAGAGPQRPGPNEYHSLFTQDGVYGMVNGYGGSDNTWGDDLVGSFLAGPLAVSLGQYHFESDGWRENADQEQDIYNGLVQWQVTPSTQLQFEYRDLDWDKGDLTPRWGGKQTQYLYDNQERETYRFSLIHSVNSQNSVALSYISQHLENAQALDISGDLSYANLDQKPEAFELQSVYFGKSLRFIYGLSSSVIDVDSQLAAGYFVESSFEVFPGFAVPATLTIDFESASYIKQRQRELYSYALWSPEQSTTIQLGLTYTDMSLSGDSGASTVTTLEAPDVMFRDVSETNNKQYLKRDLDEWSPKLGFTYNILPDITFRFAAFRAVSKTLASNQTLEPVTIAGFNQYYGDRDGLISRNAGLGLDYGVGRGVKMGASFVRRLIDGDAIRSGESTIDTKSDENLADVYVYIPIARHFAVIAGYKYAQMEDSYLSDAIDGVTEARYEAIPFGVTFFSSSAVSARLKTTYYRHKLGFNTSLSELVYDEKSAYVSDFSLNYKLPKRIGEVEAGVMNFTDEKTEVVFYKEGGESFLGFYPSRMLYLSMNLNI